MRFLLIIPFLMLLLQAPAIGTLANDPPPKPPSGEFPWQL